LQNLAADSKVRTPKPLKQTHQVACTLQRTPQINAGHGVYNSPTATVQDPNGRHQCICIYAETSGYRQERRTWQQSPVNAAAPRATAQNVTAAASICVHTSKRNWAIIESRNTEPNKQRMPRKAFSQKSRKTHQQTQTLHTVTVCSLSNSAALVSLCHSNKTVPGQCSVLFQSNNAVSASYATPK
jgi:hypothetical protein